MEASTEDTFIVPRVIGKYKVIRNIGNGGFAKVVLAIDSKTEKLYAIKVVSRDQIVKLGLLNYLENELRLSARFDHPNIVKIYDIIYLKDVICIVMEYLSNGDLQTLIASGFTFSFPEQVRIMKELLSGLSYLHKRGVSHRDIKPENVLFDQNFHPKLIDFGLSRENSSNMKTCCGTILYMAPEIICSNSGYDGMKSDIWSFAVTFHLLCNKNYPWDKHSEIQLMKDFKCNSLQLRILSNGIIGKILSMCLNFDPSERPTAQKLIEFIEDYQEQLPKFIGGNFPRKTCDGSSLPRLNIKNPLNLLAATKNSRLFASNIAWKINSISNITFATV